MKYWFGKISILSRLKSLKNLNSRFNLGFSWFVFCEGGLLHHKQIRLKRLRFQKLFSSYQTQDLMVAGGSPRSMASLKTFVHDMSLLYSERNQLYS